ncbi:MAG: ABC-2 family transporter protein [bacterium]
MKKYFKILKFSFLNQLAYPLDFIISIINLTVIAFFVTLFWRIIQGQSDIGITSITGYFLVTNGISNVFMIHTQKFGSTLRKTIKSGDLNNYIIKPINVVLALYFETLGKRIVEVTVGTIFIIIGINIIDPVSIQSLILFIIACASAMLLGISLNLFEGVLTFYTTEPDGIMNVVSHIAKIASGLWIPLTFFPNSLRSVVEYSPFAGMLFVPYSTLDSSISQSKVVSMLLVSFGWAILTLLILNVYWKKGIKKYEGIGI